jgi:hypothetical protein
LRVVEVDPLRKVVRFVPSRAVFVDLAGRETNPQIVPIPGGKQMISGRLSFVASKADQAEIHESVYEAFGSTGKVEELVPSTFGLWMYKGEEPEWERELAGGKFGSVPVQLITDTQTNLRLTVLAIVKWTEAASPIGAKVTFDWASIRNLLNEQFRASDAISAHDLSRLVDEAISHRSISLALTGAEASITQIAIDSVKPLILRRLQDVLLYDAPAYGQAEPLNAKHDGAELDRTSGWHVVYKVKKETNIANGTETIDLSALDTQFTRTAIIESELVVRK